jgi:hypothetical protein
MAAHPLTICKQILNWTEEDFQKLREAMLSAPGWDATFYCRGDDNYHHIYMICKDGTLNALKNAAAEAIKQYAWMEKYRTFEEIKAHAEKEIRYNEIGWEERHDKFAESLRA